MSGGRKKDSTVAGRDLLQRPFHLQCENGALGSALVFLPTGWLTEGRLYAQQWDSCHLPTLPGPGQLTPPLGFSFFI